MSVRGEAGAPLYFSPSEYPSLMLGVSRFEREIKNRWRRLLTPGAVIFDIGANIGITTQRFHALLSGACVVHAFEPVPRNIQLLRRNCAAFGDRVKIVEAAVGAQNGRTTFDDNTDHGALSRISDGTITAQRDCQFWRHYRTFEVNLLTLDQYCADHSGVLPSFIKLDVEGAAGLVLQGGKGILRQKKPVLSVSFHNDDEISKVLEIIRAHGYRGIQSIAGQVPSWCDPAESCGDFAHPESEGMSRLIAG